MFDSFFVAGSVVVVVEVVGVVGSVVVVVEVVGVVALASLLIVLLATLSSAAGAVTGSLLLLAVGFVFCGVACFAACFAGGSLSLKKMAVLLPWWYS